MEFELAKKLQDMDFCDVLKILLNLRKENREAYDALKESIDDL